MAYSQFQKGTDLFWFVFTQNITINFLLLLILTSSKVYTPKISCTSHSNVQKNIIFLKLGFTPCKAEQPLRGMELQEKEARSIQEICLEKTYR